MPHANPASPAADGKLDRATLADKIDALAEKAQLGSQVSFDGPANNLIVWEDCDNRVCFMAHSDGTDTERDVSRAALIVELVNARETLTRAARNEARMREALESIQEYWNRDRNDTAMFDACWHAIETAEAALGDNT